MPDFHTSWQHIPIFTKTYELYKTFYQILQSLPRKDRYTYGHRCEVLLLDLLERIIIASNSPKSEKLIILKQASTKVDLLRVIFQLGRDLKIVENKQHTLMMTMLDEIGKMLGGWIKVTLN